ncbi:hypothetical protein L596_018439 [Steinernema carpocapsae]|uniref:Uncharacterized protein n=1 Tax=Steinernema carpocapsae TaxID=34508 RepID=A0A4U5N4W6_STECR|nr:hypothetical protein L596_018439 [Steinernema carpocapsae]
MLCERPNVAAEAASKCPLKEASVQMHRSQENFEIVLQEACVQHKSVDSMKNELERPLPSRATDCSHSLLNRAENPQRINAS